MPRVDLDEGLIVLLKAQVLGPDGAVDDVPVLLQYGLRLSNQSLHLAVLLLELRAMPPNVGDHGLFCSWNPVITARVSAVSFLEVSNSAPG